jgi:oligoribonuclease
MLSKDIYTLKRITIMKFVSIDIETTGLNPRLHSILEVALVCYDTQQPNFRESFHCFIDYPKGHLWDRETMKFHRERLDYFLNGEPRYQFFTLADAIYNFIKNDCLTTVDRQIVAAGKNFNGFDKQFLNELPNFKARDVFRYRSIDVGSMCLVKEDNDIPSLKMCLQRMGLGEIYGVTHTAMDDAEAVAAIVRKFYGSFDRFNSNGPRNSRTRQ